MPRLISQATQQMLGNVETNLYFYSISSLFAVCFTQSTVLSCIYRSEETGPPGHADEEQPFGLEDEEQSIGESLEDETDGTDDRDDKYLFKKKERMSRSVESLKVKPPLSHEHWGPTEYKKSNHPLSIMVGSSRSQHEMLEQNISINIYCIRYWVIFIGSRF